MKGFIFTELPVYIVTKELIIECNILLKLLLSNREFAIADQLKRALYSILLNIAEGITFRSNKDKRKFLIYALGSVNETVACLDILKDSKILSLEKFDYYLDKLQIIAKQLNGLINYFPIKHKP